MSMLNDPKLESFLDALHAQSEGQNDAINAYFRKRIEERSLSWDGFDADTTRFFADKMVALEKVKAEYCYALCRAMRAKRIVECGTSYGVSTLYLAAAVRDGGGGQVIATEWEAAKAEIAQRNFETAGLAQYIDLRQGDLAQTLARIDGPVDFVLLDIWTEAVLPAIRHIAPHLHPGSVIVADNTSQSRPGYRAYFDYIADPRNRLRTMTLPFDGGLEMTIRV
jgi:predicted O-methyltransferase YrrM